MVYIQQHGCGYHPGAYLIEDYREGNMIYPECGMICGHKYLDARVEWNSRPLENSMNVNPEGDIPQNESRNQQRIFNPTLKMAARNIKEMAGKLNLTKAVVDKAIHLFNTIHDTEFLKGKTEDSIGSACLYITCRIVSMPRTLKEVFAVFNDHKIEIAKVCFGYQYIHDSNGNYIIPIYNECSQFIM
ncbi:hypothetical protein QYM36_011253 [Artemia franciscana]|uniref:Transcription factor TFIIB cyclin-like domain-containing protein n=1 Tax=Artemia franciscana TaxID=6661 RepID=A0AA88L118_ARTSF|nr:hypothetical protein QYM36_011253 [Artemia franciscana]